MTFNTLQEIKDHQFIGTHFHDSAVFRAIDTFTLRDDVPIADKAEAIRIMVDKGMGCGREEQFTDEELVSSQLALMAEYNN